MSPKASSDFGLYKEKQKDNNLKAVKFILVAVVAILFFFVILYALVVYIISSDSDGENTYNTEKPPAKAEKLVLAHSVKTEILQSTPPKPFGVTYQGQRPSEFTPSTEKTPRIYSQQSPFRHRYYPHNIQEVIGYANMLNKPAATNSIKRTRNHKQSSTENISQMKRSTRNLTTYENDPFYSYKPKNPGEINLLATASFRFAPPPWSNLKTQFPRIYAQQYQENTKRHEVFNVHPKPLSVTLNIYPNKENQRYNQHGHGVKQYISNRIESIRPRVRFPESKTKKMVINLNLYPDDVHGDESRVHGDVVASASSSPSKF